MTRRAARGAGRREWREARKYIDLVQVLLVVLDREGRIKLVNRKACDVLGRPKAELVGRDWFETCLPESFSGPARAVFDRLMAGEAEAGEYYENPVRTVTGEERMIAWRNRVLLDGRGRPSGTLSSGEELSERIATEQALRDSEARNAAILEAAVEGIVTIDERGTIQTFNPAASRIFGYEPGEVIGRNVRMLVPSPHRENHDAYLARYLETGEAQIIGTGREVEGVRKDGRVFPLELAIGEVQVAGRRLFTGLIRDLTPMKRMQEEMLRNRNLAAIGEMAASLAHEIKNPLAGISSVMQVLRADFPEDDQRHELFEELLGLVSRLDKTVKDLLIFARPWTPQTRKLRISDIARHVATGTRRDEQFEGIEIRLSGDESLEAPVDPQLLEQVFWNLFLNAAQAMDGGGRIEVEFEPADGGVRVVVSDDGPGIPEEVRDRVFQPFATTKARGTGLGLAISRRILEAHGGAISVASEEGEGTRIVLQFPAGNE
jgi:two-component system sensor kinase FixL